MVSFPLPEIASSISRNLYEIQVHPELLVTFEPELRSPPKREHCGGSALLKMRLFMMETSIRLGPAAKTSSVYSWLSTTASDFPPDNENRTPNRALHNPLPPPSRLHRRALRPRPSRHSARRRWSLSLHKQHLKDDYRFRTSPRKPPQTMGSHARIAQDGGF